MSISEKISQRSAQISLAELRRLGELKVAQPHKVAAKIERFTGVCVNVDSGMVIRLKTTTDSNRCILSGTISIDGVAHRVAAKYVVCNPSLNARAWNVTEPTALCPLCFNVPTQLSLF